MNSNALDPVLVMENVMFLKKNPLFSQVRTEELRAIAAICSERDYRTGQCIVKENDPGDSLFIVKSGSIKVTKSMGAQEVLLAVLPRESCFGEMVIFEDAPRSASCAANEDCILLNIQREDLIEVIMEYPGIAVEMFGIFGKRLREANDKIRHLSQQLSRQKQENPQ